MTVKSWFLNKEFNHTEKYAITTCDREPTVERETEKAVLLKWRTDYGIVTHWIPKSCVE